LHLHLTRRSVWLIGLVAVILTALWGSLSLEIIGLLAQYQGNAESEAGRPALLAGAPNGPVPGPRHPSPGSSGPWGRIEYRSFSLEPPDEFVTVPRARTPELAWHFEDFTTQELRDFFARLELTDAQREHLLAPRRWTVAEESITVRPAAEMVWSLPLEARQTICAELANSPANLTYHLPFTRQRQNVATWFQRSELRPETVELVRALTYTVGNSVCFADVDMVLNKIQDPAESRRLLKTLWRQEALLMTLRIEPGDDLRALQAYWSHGPHARNSRALLESQANSPLGGDVDVVHLLPPMPRRLLNTFAFPASTGTGMEHNCYWTAMNFFAQTPDDQCFDLQHARSRLDAEFFPVADEPRFGDVILVARADGRIIHAANYIADDVVFTKNGGQFRRPWVLMKMDEMLAIYPSNLPLKLYAFRRKET